MQVKSQISLARKPLYGIVLLGLFFSAFGAGNLQSARAQEGAPETPTAEVQVQETATPAPEEALETATSTSEVESQTVVGGTQPNNYHFEPPQKYLSGGAQLGRENQSPSQAELDVSAQALTLGAVGLNFSYAQTFGTSEIPYFSDTTHLNRPEGLFIDASNNLYVAESQGSRILRYNSSGTNTLSIGKAGVSYTDDYVFQNTTDAALDSSENIWVADNSRVVQYNSSGVLLQSLPAQNDNPWQMGNTNGRFDNIRGIAFGSDGRMYVSDSNNQRVQVYTFTAGTPVYSATIGTSGTSGNDNTHLNTPGRIAVYGNNDLYVVDNGNNRVQHCIFSSSIWSCTTLDSGLNNPQGITVDSSKNVFIADTQNGRIRKCTSVGVCSTFVSNTHSSWSHDLAVDSSGNIYSAESWSNTVVKYNSLGNYVSTFAGINGVPYLTDSYHYNHPRVAIDSSNNIIIVEENGQRLTKLNASGIPQWSVGVPGVDNPNDNVHFNWPHGVAVDMSGNIYVADNSRVQIFSGSGTYLTTLGTGYGTGNYQFNWAAGIAVDTGGNIYVSDCPNHRVQIYNNSRTYLGTLGVTGISGSDNGHLNCPIGISVDSARNIYVADAGNNRVQKFNSSGTWQMTLGTPGPWGSGSEDFAHFGSGPEDIAVDAQGRIYVADISNTRVQVFDSSGAYLTTIGGAWGANTGQFRNTSGVDVDSQGNVYVTDFNNARIQKFTIGTPNWTQTNLNGFGDHNNQTVNRMSVFNGYLYAGTHNESTGGEVWRSINGVNWSQVNLDGFGNTNNIETVMAESFYGNLYVGTSNSITGGEIWRCAVCDGSDWTKVASGGFGDTKNALVERVIVFSNTLYATTNSDTGVEVWKSSTGDLNSWTQSNTDGFGDTKNTGLWAASVFNGYLYVSTGQWGVPWDSDTYTGTEVWRTNNGTTWSQVNTDGFGDRRNMSPWLASFNGYLYVLSLNFGTGGQIWRCATCDGTDWTQVVSNGFGDINNIGGSFMLSFGDRLYAGTSNDITGVEIWNTSNGTNWSQANVDGFGDSNNNDTRGGIVFNNSLFIGTFNWANGTEIWSIALPAPASIIRADANPSAASSVSFTVTFSKPVTGVSTSAPFDDFALTASSSVSGASITNVSGSGTTYTVTVNTGFINASTGTGTLRLDVPNTATITDLVGNSLTSLPFTGAVYTVNKPPTAATLTAPKNAIGANYNPTYTWDKVLSASYYHLYVAGPSGTALDQWFDSSSICDTTTCSVMTSPSSTLAGGNYSWFVQTYNPIGYGPWSNNAQPTTFSTTIQTTPAAAVLTAPKNDIGTDYNPNYTWDKVASATYYHLYVAGPSGVVLDQWYPAASICPAATCSVPSPVLAGGNYAWYVQTYNSVGYGPWSNNTQATNFSTTVPTAPAAAVLTAPKNDIATNYNPAYTWGRVATAIYYHLYVAGPSGVALDQWYQASNICDATACSVASPTLGGGAYVWYVQTYNAAGYGPWSNNSQPTNFNTSTTPPAAAVLTAPTTNIGTDYNPNYTWGKVAAATWYHLYVGGPAGVVLDQWYSTSICDPTTCTVASPTLGGGAYFWYVQTYGPAGYGPWSNNTQPTNFSTTMPSAPAAAVLTAPKNAIGTDYNPTYTWGKVVSASYYHLYVAGPSGVVLDQWYPASGICNTTTCSVISPILGGGAHVWYVQTYNAAGYGPWSTENFSTTTLSAPVGATLTAPSGTISLHTPTYTWDRVSMATWYHLYIKGPSGVVKDQWYQASSVCNTTTCSVVSPTLESGFHTWWVQTYNSAGYGPWKNATFTVSP